MIELTADTLPLDVRECLMRANEAEAISILQEKYDMSEAEAQELIKTYREKLRERKVELEIKKIQLQSQKESDEEKQVYIRWGIRIALMIFCLILLYLLTGDVYKKE